jgi:ABC-type sugar transport system ATPase subunit
MSTIELRDISKRFPKTGIVLSNVNLHTEENELLVILGPSGCGKSTLLTIIAGLEKASSGQVLIDKIPIDSYDPSERNVGMVFQSYSLYPHLSAYENIAFPLRLRKINLKEIKKTVMEIAKLLDIVDCLYRKPANLSGGQRQRVAIGRAIARKPKIYLFDEPLSNLDAALREKMRAELVKIHSAINSVFIYVTHDQTEAMAIGDRIAVLNNGVIQQIDTPLNIYYYPCNTFVASFIGTPKMNFVSKEIYTVLSENDKKHPVNPHLIYGIRPEDIYINQTNISNEAFGIITMIEPLGRETSLHISILNEEVIVCIGNWDIHSSLRIGESVYMKTNPERWHFYDAFSGQRCENHFNNACDVIL